MASNCGSYLLVLKCRQRQAREVGALGVVALQPGYYLYVGSARRGLAARLARHARPDKKRRWHIDYLLDGQTLMLQEIWHSCTLAECSLAASLLALPATALVMPRFGASDCRCPAHFCRYEDTLSRLRQHLQTLGLRIWVGGEGDSRPKA